jgi:2-(1,2-epoxy-1,2-dihydrophenyl)acetyl-CoA isomerase
MEGKDIIYEKADRIATVTLNRPESRNAMGGTLSAELGQALEEANRDDEVGVLIITGAGKGFCSGADLSSLGSSSRQVGRGLVSRSPAAGGISSFALQLQNFEKPVIAAVNGAAAGAGLSLALACDIRIASDRARFTQIFIKRGLVPDTGSSYFLPRIVGMERALQMVLTGDILDAQQALEYGLVSRVVLHDELMKEARDLAGKLAAGPPVALKLAKRAGYKGATSDLASALEFEGYLQGVCFGTEDFREGVSAFLEKREPNFTGK